MGFEDIKKQVLNILNKEKKFDQFYIENEYIGNYMMVRWLSFIIRGGDYVAPLVVFLSNYVHIPLSTKWEEYIYMYNFVPQIPGKRINFEYIKKPPVSKDKDEKFINEVVNILEISKKDAKYIIEQDKNLKTKLNLL